MTLQDKLGAIQDRADAVNSLPLRTETLADARFYAAARTDVPRLINALLLFRADYWKQAEALTESSAIADEALARIDAQLLTILEAE